ncbi:hypothetical protein OCA5_c11950 [Afipia carboxidovorans OM5]|uniref:Uncharacterized protein n=2 Tax=Afipia carboxidovorans TaxID=40137 RepID=F8BUW4_AFIC5|nr:hypothetical protein OCA4_c11950 [Afipia carboxidovorans OM4]AEI05913.1 hypothetical protein OCA5_c11950 [Afipia carboxidovorans OM5]
MLGQPAPELGEGSTRRGWEGWIWEIQSEAAIFVTAIPRSDMLTAITAPHLFITSECDAEAASSADDQHVEDQASLRANG